jgi:putative membrane-bound dehydrogenase-like protein
MNQTLRLTCLCCLLAACGTKDRSPVQTADATGPQVPEGYVIEVAADSTLVDFPMFSTLDEFGRLFVFESTGDKYNKTQEAIDNPQFRINLLEDTNTDGRYDKSTIYADKVGFPQGGVFYKGSLYASSAPDLIKFTDTNGDGVADTREVILSGWILNVNANSLIGPSMAPDGWLYMTNAIMGFDVTTKEGERLKGGTARIWRVRPDGSGLEWISAGGMNNPVELAYTEASEPIGTETYFTDPKAGERDALVYWTEGGVYPKPNDNIKRDKLPLTGDLMPVVSKFSRVSPSGIGRYRHTALGADFKDNLFSAQFNTHRVLRHKLIRQGASFRTEDEAFFWNNTNEDFHPTDVLEDADGSLLIVETGGWFIKGCPLSQVSKPQLKGAIYRVRKKDAPRAADPYGNAINWITSNPEQLVQYLENPNPFLADRAQQSLVDRGNAAVKALTALRRSSKDANARTKAVFALYRIGTPDAMSELRLALTDADEQVRVAAARSVGIAKDRASVPSLLACLDNGPDAVKRQAATALGQIGDQQAVAPLINASANTEDRFIRHAIIYALMRLNDVNGLRARLADTSVRVREAVIITLDQMPNAPLTVQELTPFLTHEHKRLRQTALWAASHHPEWSADMTRFLDAQLQVGQVTTENKALLADILVAFGGEAAMQRFIAAKLGTGNREQQLFFLEGIKRMELETFPSGWTTGLARILSGGADPQVKQAAIELASLRSIRALDPQLTALAKDDTQPVPLRMQAIETLTSASKTLSPAHFAFLTGQLTRKTESANAQQAATILGNAKLGSTELQWLCDQYLPKADPFILPKLLPAFQGEYPAEIGRALASTLENSSTLDGYSEERLRKIFEQYPAEVKPAVDKLLARLNAVHADRIKYLKEIEASLGDGELDKGRVLFFGKATCYSCHKVGPEGGDFGPDLTSIQRDRSVHDLLEAIVFPSASFVREYETYKISTANGDVTGIIKSKTPEEMVLATSLQNAIRIPSKEVKSTAQSDISMMPMGLDKLLTKKEMADLMAFLLGQDQDPDTDQQILRRTQNK